MTVMQLRKRLRGIIAQPKMAGKYDPFLSCILEWHYYSTTKDGREI